MIEGAKANDAGHGVGGGAAQPLPDQPASDARRLPLEVRHRVIELYAQFQTTSTVKELILKEFDLDLGFTTLRHYDLGATGIRRSPRITLQLEQARAAYVASAANMAMAHQVHRLRNYQDVYDKALKAKDFSAALKAMELAAKEMGGVLTNATTVKHEGAVEHRHLSIGDAKAELAMRLSAAIDMGVLDVVATPVPASEPDCP